MARQGKMNSSPFHIETRAYKYAVEHENEGYQILEKQNDCTFYSAKTEHCTLWNSGYQLCNKHRCRFRISGLRRLGNCASCAYCYKGCQHPKKPLKDSVKGEKASFCAFFVTKQMDSRKYHALHDCAERIVLSSELKRARKIVKSGNRFIKQSQNELGKMEVGTASYQSLVAQIDRKKARVRENSDLIDNLERRLDALGGIMTEWPKKISLKNT